MMENTPQSPSSDRTPKTPPAIGWVINGGCMVRQFIFTRASHEQSFSRHPLDIHLDQTSRRTIMVHQ